MNKLLLTLGTVLLISGCSKEPNIDLNCIAGGGDSNFLFTIDTAKKEFIFYEGSERLASYTNDGDKLISEKIFINWELKIEQQKKFMSNSQWQIYSRDTRYKIDDEFDEYYIMTFNKINGDLVESDFTEKLKKNKYFPDDMVKPIKTIEETTLTFPCSVIQRVME